jgi:hypothetical protein
LLLNYRQNRSGSIRETVFSWTRTHFPIHIRSAKKLTLNETSVVTVLGKAFWDLGHAPQRSIEPAKAHAGLPVWEIHPAVWIVADARDANAQNSNLFSDGGISAAYRERKWTAISASCVLALAVTRKLVTSKFANWALCLCRIGVLGMEIQLRRKSAS